MASFDLSIDVYVRNVDGSNGALLESKAPFRFTDDDLKEVDYSVNEYFLGLDDYKGTALDNGANADIIVIKDADRVTIPALSE